MNHPLPDQIRRLNDARDDIYEIRRHLEALRATLAAGSIDTINSARLELCSALVRRLEIAESEIRELLDMLNLDKAP